VKTAISLPDKTFEEGEKLAQKLGISRSELYARALKQYVERHGEEAEIETFNRVYDKIDSRLDPAMRRAVKKRLEANEW